MPKALSCTCGKCRTCYQREYQREYRKRRPLTEEQRQRAGARAKAWAKANPERHAATVARGHQRYPERQAARMELNKAVARGEIQRQPCEVCGSERAHGHHDDYTKPLEVRWMCPKHHSEHHAKRRP